MNKLYGVFHQPYRLPAFLTLRVFALELIRQRLIVENENFPSFRKYSEIRFTWAIGPFNIKNKDDIPLVESLIRDLGFPTMAGINYDPHDIVPEKRKDKKKNL